MDGEFLAVQREYIREPQLVDEVDDVSASTQNTLTATRHLHQDYFHGETGKVPY